MPMKFFTREWITSELKDEEFESVVPAYNRHLVKITPHLTPNLHNFVKTVNLHDGIIRRIVVDYTELILGLYLRCGDLQQGYYDLDIRYKDIQIDKAVVDTLAMAALNEKTEILYDELDITDDNKYIHRMIFYPDYEISIKFQDLEYEQIKKNNRDFLIATEKFEIIR
jgi:Protein of unknown function (DUF4085)